MRSRTHVATWLVLALSVLVVGCTSSSPQTTSAGDDGVTLPTAPATQGTSSSSTSTTEAGPTSSATLAQTTTTGPPSPAKTTFLREGNAICARMNDQLAGLRRRLEAERPGPETVAAVLEESAQITERAVAQLRALAQPPDGADRLEAMYADVDEVVRLTRRFVEALQAGDVAAAARTESAARELTAEVNADFKAYGLDECGRSV
jgi:hypothetical protein